MSKYQYKNVTDSDLLLVGFGIVKEGKTFESDVIIENPNLKLVETNSAKKKKPVNKDEGDDKRD